VEPSFEGEILSRCHTFLRRRHLPLKLIWDLDDPYHNFVGIAILIDEVEFDHRIVALQIAFNVYDLISLKMFFNLLLENVQRIGEIYFERTRVIARGFHSIKISVSAVLFAETIYQRIKAEAQVKPLPNAARQIKSFSFILPSAQASLIAIGIDAAVVLPYRMMLL
jgi:hypothetical protein